MAAGGRKNADDAFAVAFAAGRTVAGGAAAAGISERTAARRWADPAFRQRVGELTARALGRLADGMAEAAVVLRELLATGTPLVVRLGTCRPMLELGVKLRENVGLLSPV